MSIIKKIEIEGDEENMSLCAQIICSTGDSPSNMLLDIWYEWSDEKGYQNNKVETSFNFHGGAAIALRDFLIYCFPVNEK